MMWRSQAAPSWRWLAGLTLAVMLAHAWLLRAAPGAFVVASPLTQRALITRTVEMRPSEGTHREAATPVLAPQPIAAPMATDRPEIATRQAAAGQTPQDNPALQPTDVSPPVPEAPTEVAVSAPTTHASRTDRLRAADAFTIPGSVRMRYAVQGESRRLPYRADAALDWRQDGAQYEARLEISTALGTRRQSSVGRITPDGLTPTRFADKARNEQAAHFEWAKGKIIFSNNAPDAPLLSGAQDRLSVLLQLGAIVAGAPGQFGEGSTIEIQTASAREADTWLFTVMGTEKLLLPGGEVESLKLQRMPRREFDQKVELWLAPDMEYLPVRLRLTQSNGDYVDQQWLATDRL